MNYSARLYRRNYLLRVSGYTFGIMLILAGAMGSVVHPENWFLIGILLVIMAIGLLVATAARLIAERRERHR